MGDFGQERKNKSEKRLKEMGIAYNEWLPLVESAEDVRLRSIEDICRRAVTCLLSIQLSCDIAQGEYEESKQLFSKLLEKYSVNNYLIEKERKLFDGSYSEQDAVDIAWTYEAYWSLVWALNLIDDISDASEICDCQKAIDLVSRCETLEEFQHQCHLRDVDEILDMLDLFYRYDWACTEKRLNPDTPIGNLNPEVVVERRRGLEWLISEKDDWFDIPLNT